MKIKFQGILMILLAFCSTAVFAQRPGGQGNMDPAAMKQRLIDSAQLTGPQADSVIAIGQEYRPKMRDIFSDESMSQDDKRAKMAELNEQRNKRLQTALGDDAFKKYQAYEQKMRQQRGGRGMGGGGNQ